MIPPRLLPSVLIITLALMLSNAGCRREHTANAAGVTEIKFWNGFTGPDGKTMERMVRDFETENSDIRVRMQIIPWAQYYDKLTLGIAFHEGPDVFVCHGNHIPEFARYEVFKPLEPLQTGPQGLPAADFLPQTWDAAHYHGVLCGIPLDCHPLGLYYNRRLFRDAGILDERGEPKPPTTWQEFLSDAHRLTRSVNGDKQWGFAFTWQHSNWYLFAYQHGGSPLTPDLKHAAIDQPPCVEATEQMRSLIADEKVAPSPEGIDAWRGFRQGRVAMAMEGIYMLGDLKQSEGLDYAGAPVPQFGPVRATWAGSHILCIPREEPEDRITACWRFIRYLSDHSLDWADGGQVPARQSLRETPRFRAMRVQSEFARQLPYARYEPPSPRATEINPFIDDAVEASLLGIVPPRQALREAAARIDRALSHP